VAAWNIYIYIFPREEREREREREGGGGDEEEEKKHLPRNLLIHFCALERREEEEGAQ